MSERYSRLFTLPENLYAVGSPVVIAAGTLLKDNQTGKIVAQLKLRSISNKTIKAVKVSLNLFDTAVNPIGNAVEYEYLDLDVSRDTEFGQKNPVFVAESKARSYEVAVTEVVFADRSVWSANTETWEPLSRPVPLKISDPELLKQYKIRFGNSSTYEPKEEKDLWYCTCGELNHTGEGCHCGNSLFELQALDMAELVADKDARLAQEAAALAAEKEERKAAKKKTAKILKIIISAVCAISFITLLVTMVIIPNSKYNNAVALMEAEKYAEAIVAFEAMDGYKDSAEQIVKCEDAIAAAEQSRIEAEKAAEAARKEAENAADYAEAEKMAVNGETAKAAMAFGRLGDYRDAREKSYALWDTIVVRKTFDNGSNHTVGVQNSGKVLAVGSNEHGQTDVHNWTDIQAISTGYLHTIGIKSNGALVSTGLNNYGQCDVQSWTDIVSVSAGGYHTVGLKSDGTVVAIGYDKEDNRCEVGNWTNIVAISGGGYHTVGLKADGTVVAVGYSKDDSRCAVSSWSDIVAISAGRFHTVGLKADGTVVATGSNEYGQCDVSAWQDVIAVSTGRFHTVGLKADGTVITTGSGGVGQCDVGDWKDIFIISARNGQTVGIKADGTILAVGYNENNECNVADWTDIKLPN